MKQISAIIVKKLDYNEIISSTKSENLVKRAWKWHN